MIEKYSAPNAKKVPHELVKHNDKRIDNYFWLNQRENPEVVEYLNQEKEFYEQSTANTKQFQVDLYDEMKARIKEDDESVPYFYNEYWYITRFEKGKGYPIYSRKKILLTAQEEILFDCNEMAKDFAYFNMTGLSVSEDNKWISFGVDTVSRRQYTIQFKNLETNEILPYKIENTTGGATWANDNSTLFYSRKDEQTLRPDKIFKHKLNSNPEEDKVVYFEKDETFDVAVYKSKSKKYIILASSSTLTTEYQTLLSATPDGDFKIFQKRTRELEYSISHFEDKFYIVTNKDDATNFKLMITPETATSKENWIDLIPHREEVLFEGIDIFNDYLVVSEKSNGLNQIKIMPWNGEAYYLPFDIETYSCSTTTNIDFDTEILRYSYQSLATPASLIDFNMRTKEKTILKEQPVLGGTFDKNNYVEERIWATAKDGIKIPISMVYKKGIKKDNKNPLLLYAYGSYGVTIDPYFSTTRLSGPVVMV